MISSEYARYEKTLTVSAVNYASVWGDKAANLRKIKDMTTTAKRLGSNMVVFPELALSGYECSEDCRQNHATCAMHRQAAEPVPGPSTLELAGLARDLDIYLIVGMPELGAKSEVYNSAAVIGPEGIIGSYRKVHLSLPYNFTEAWCFTPGDEVPVYETRYGPIGVHICFDFWCFPEVARIQWLKGARVIINPTAAASGPGRDRMVSWVTGARAAESRVFVVTANLTGKERTGDFPGGSLIAGPEYPRAIHVFAEAGSREEIITATLSFERQHYFLSLGDFRNAINLDLVAREYGKLAEKRRKS